MSDHKKGLYEALPGKVGDIYQTRPETSQKPSREQLPPLSSLFGPTSHQPRQESPQYESQDSFLQAPRPQARPSVNDWPPNPYSSQYKLFLENTSSSSKAQSDHRLPPFSNHRPEPESRPSYYDALHSTPVTPNYPPTPASTVSGEPTTVKDGLGPKIWTGTQFLPRFIRQAEVPGEGMCYFYDDGTHCKTVIGGEVVNAHWGVTKSGKPRKRLAIACITCREKKIKCDPDYPRCIQCEKFGRVCRFKNAPRGEPSTPNTPPLDPLDSPLFRAQSPEIKLPAVYLEEDWPESEVNRTLDKHLPPTFADASSGLRPSPFQEPSPEAMTEEIREAEEPEDEGSIFAGRRNYRRQVLFKRLWNAVHRIFRPPLAPGRQRVEWSCNCGDELYADFTNTSPEELGSIVKILQTGNRLTSHSPSALGSDGSGNNIMSDNSNSSGARLHSPARQDLSMSSLTDQSTSMDRIPSLAFRTSRQLPTQDPTFLELCVNTGEHLKTLGEIDLTSVRCDGELFKMIKEHYLRLRSIRSKFWLLKPATISYVRFSVENRHRVGILQKPLALPPKSEVDSKNYIYSPCPLNGDPPIAENLFLHYLQCTEGSNTLFWMLRLPRKVHPSILASTNKEAAFGWGVHIGEGPNYKAIFWVNFAALILSGATALVWKVLENDFQGAFGFASWVVMVLNTLMMAYLFKWRQE